MPKVIVYVMPRPTLLDAQGRTIQTALHDLGFQEAQGVRIGRRIEMEIEAADADEARRRARTMCEKLLANPVTEDFQIEVVA